MFLTCATASWATMGRDAKRSSRKPLSYSGACYARVQPKKMLTVPPAENGAFHWISERNPFSVLHGVENRKAEKPVFGSPFWHFCR